MSLSAGVHLGPYEILSAIGAGRDVAIKVLPDAFANDAERMARFEREAQVLASLNHPNIATIYGLEESSAVRAGIGVGAMSLEDALPIAKQIGGLEYVHGREIFHPYLKPANLKLTKDGQVKLTKDGQVKLLDFRLAKAMDKPAPAPGNPSTSATLTIGLHAGAGVILGTALIWRRSRRGAAVGKRADIWAYGAIL